MTLDQDARERRSACIQMPQAAAFMDWLLRHWREEGVAVQQLHPGAVQLALADVGQLDLALVSNQHLDCSLQPISPRMGDLMQLSLTDHLAEYADEAAWPEGSWRIVWNGEPTRSAVQLHVLRVVSQHAISERMRRLRLQGDGVQAFAQNGLHVRLLLPGLTIAGSEPAWPTVMEDGRLQWPVGQARLARRTYTLSAVHVDDEWVEVDALLHHTAGKHGRNAAPGADWAEQALVGSHVGVLSPAGGLLPQAARCVLVADACAMPAAARIVQAQQSAQPVKVLLWVADKEERTAWRACAQQAQISWLHGGLPGSSQLEIAQVLQWLQHQWAAHSKPDAEPALLWVAGGLSLTQAVRRWVAAQPSQAYWRVMIHTYWR